MLFSDDFEAARGWTLTAGCEHGDHRSMAAWRSAGHDFEWNHACSWVLATGRRSTASITGLAAGSAAGANDVDGGMTSIQSPAIALPAGSTITLRFRFYLAHLNNATSADYLPGSRGGKQRPATDLVHARRDRAATLPACGRRRL